MHLKADGTEGEVATAVQYREDGFTVVAELFTRQEVAWIARACVAAGAATSPKAIREPNGDLRSRFFERGDCPIIDAVVRQRRLVGRAQALLGSRVYAYQVKVNSKRALQGEAWPWHQDYIFWREKDGLPKPRVLTAGLFLDDATEFNGPIYFVPGSHRQGVLPPMSRDIPADDYANDLSKDLNYQLTHEVVASLVTRSGMSSVTGKSGSVVFFDGNVAHCSPNNLSPFDRRILFVTYCSVENVPRPESRQRPNFLCNRDTSPLDMLDAADLAAAEPSA
ncbi:MAG TPA: phytanoyl-CoA dioxygenase family protein [Burkholderiaceae bacterium]|nr:phytanoyl-CoA dioxygenase family protein [Burkholderiaceae bacterium]